MSLPIERSSASCVLVRIDRMGAMAWFESEEADALVVRLESGCIMTRGAMPARVDVESNVVAAIALSVWDVIDARSIG